MSRKQIIVDSVFYWIGWDNPTNTYFIDRVVYCCTGCSERQLEKCSQACGHPRGEELEDMIGPLAGRFYPDLSDFVSVLWDEFNIELNRGTINSLAAEKAFARPTTELQRSINQMFGRNV